MIKSLSSLFGINKTIAEYEAKINSLKEDKAIQDSIIEALELALAELKIKLDQQTMEYMVIIAAICLQNNGELYLEQDNVHAVSASTAALRMEEAVRASKKCFRYYLEETKSRKKKKKVPEVCEEGVCDNCKDSEILDEVEKEETEE